MVLLVSRQTEMAALILFLSLQTVFGYIPPFRVLPRKSNPSATRTALSPRPVAWRESSRFFCHPQQLDRSVSPFAGGRSSTALAALLGDGGASLGATGEELLRSLFSYSGNVPLWQAFCLNAALFAALQKKLFKMLTPTGFAHAMALGTMLWATLGWRGWTLCVLYLFLGQAVTKVKFEDKEKRGIAESRGGRRGPENVWGSALTALICAACSVQGESFLGIGSDLFCLGFVAALATKLADTFASEIGKAYGKTTFLITTLERVKPGTEGAISAEGTAAALVGGLFLPVYGYAVGLIDRPAILIAAFAAFFATNVESLLGATLQGKQGFEFMTNEVVNFFNTLIGATVAMMGYSLF